jgi:hypothetical protein
MLSKIVTSFGGVPGRFLLSVHRWLFSVLASIPGFKYGKLLGLDYRVQNALRRQQFDRAAGLANALLEVAREYPDDWNYGNAVHKGHLALGWVRLQEGDIEGAKHRLLEAGRTVGSAQLNTFGPNMSLAAELLRRGESEAVLEYLRLCREFWEMGNKQLDYWQWQIRSGQEPDFGANLRY